MGSTGIDNNERRQPATRRVLVLLLPQVHALDFAGPVQTLYEANGFGADYHLHYVASEREIQSAQGFQFGAVEPLPDVEPSDWILVPGIESSSMSSAEFPLEWIRQAAAVAERLSSICSGAFPLAKAGVLENRSCTTHWKLISTLREWSPTSRVLENRLFVRDGNLFTSAGEASGIDMALSHVQEDCGPSIAAKVAREMVVYFRRNGESGQQSVFLQHRDHLHPGIHRVQDWILEHPSEKATLENLALIAAVSPRHLTRLFRGATGITLIAFVHKVKLEIARSLAGNHDLTVDSIAHQCGFDDARQLRRLWHAHHGSTLGLLRREQRRCG